MKNKIFISYANNDQDLLNNLAGRLKELNIDVWIYSRNKTYGKNAWNEIKDKILISNIFIYAFSSNSVKAKGQKRELNIALKNSKNILPLSVNDELFHLLPLSIRFINGDKLDCYNVKEISQKIVNRYFSPKKIKKTAKWYFPIPGDWLRVVNLNRYTESDLEIGDFLLFRKISPMGLFECYAPKLNGFYWIFHEDVVKHINVDDIKRLNSNVPNSFSTMKMLEIDDIAQRSFYRSLKQPS